MEVCEIRSRESPVALGWLPSGLHPRRSQAALREQLPLGQWVYQEPAGWEGPSSGCTRREWSDSARQLRTSMVVIQTGLCVRGSRVILR